MLEKETRESPLIEYAWEFFEGHRVDFGINGSLREVLGAYKILETRNPILMNNIREELIKKLNGEKIDSLEEEIRKAIGLTAEKCSMDEYNREHGTYLSPKRVS